MNFDGSQIVIGRGAQAEVLSYYGCAYKVYQPSYPAEWISFEMQQQQAVNKAGICPVRYYATDDPHVIKMDLIEGDTLEKRVREGFQGGFELMAEAFRKVHAADIDGINMPRFIETAGMGLDDESKNVIFPIIERLSKKMQECICHLDMHFLNMMVSKEAADCVIIDWINARIAPAVFDYARSYVIIEESAKELLDQYMKAIKQDLFTAGISDEDFSDALTVCRVMRKCENQENDSIIIKLAETDDELCGRGYVHCTSWQEAYRGIVCDRYLDTMTVEATTARARQFPENTLVAKDKDKVVGFAVYSKSRDEDLPDAGEVDAIYVLSEYYGKKIGYRLMNEACSRLSEYNTIFLWVFEKNERAIRFYHKLGFEFDGSKKEWNLGTPVSIVRMVRSRK